MSSAGWKKLERVQTNNSKEQLAFPQPGANGMTIREYFAAHAPSQSESWFAPNIPGVPERPRLSLPHGNTAQVGHCAECKEYFEAQAKIDLEYEQKLSEYEMQRFVLWRWAYADAMIKAQNKQ